MCDVGFRQQVYFYTHSTHHIENRISKTLAKPCPLCPCQLATWPYCSALCIAERSRDLSLAAMVWYYGLSEVRRHLIWPKDKVEQTHRAGSDPDKDCQVRGNPWTTFLTAVSTSAVPELCSTWLQLLYSGIQSPLEPLAAALWCVQRGLDFCLPISIHKNISALTGQYGRKHLFFGTDKKQVKTCASAASFHLVHK